MGKKIKVTTEELEKASNSLKKISESYTVMYRKIFQEVDTMGEAWQGDRKSTRLNSSHRT